MKKPFAPGNAWMQRILELEAQLRVSGVECAELRGRVHELELLLAAAEQRASADCPTQ
jgi:hypothetical protein